MSSLDFLYELMPVIYRQRDVETGYALRTLMRIFGAQYNVLRDDIAALYDNWFAETASPDLLPYIAELLGIMELPAPGEGDPRRLVADAIGYRRRKGIARYAAWYMSDATGWSVRVNDYTKLVLQHQDVADVRMHAQTSVSVRNLDALDRMGTWDEGTAHFFDVNDRFTLRTLGVFVWRTRSYPIEDAMPFAVRPNCYTFDPSGIDTPLFAPVDDTRETVPAPLDARAVADLLRTSSRSLPFSIRTATGEVDRRAIRLADLDGWEFPSYAPDDAVVVDVARGRFMTGTRFGEQPQFVSYAYGLSGAIGGGPYARAALEETGSPVCVRALPGREAGDGSYRSIAEALSDEGLSRHSETVVEVVDSASYSDSFTIEATANRARSVVIRARSGQRPALLGGICVDGSSGFVRVHLQGLRIRGPIRVSGQASVTIEDVTIVPDRRHALDVDGTDVALSIVRSICGEVHVSRGQVRLHVLDSVIDGCGADAVRSLPSADVRLSCERTTFLGEIDVTELHARDSVFSSRMTMGRSAQSSITMCAMTSVPTGVRDLQGMYPEAPGSWFASVRYGDPGYAAFASSAPGELFEGASNGKVIGAFHELGLPVREHRLKKAAQSTLPYGLSLQVRYET